MRVAPLFVSLCSFCVSDVGVLAQDSGDARTPAFGTLPWVVVKGSLADFTGKVDKIVGEYESKAEAAKAAKDLYGALPANERSRWLYDAVKRAQKGGSQVVPSGPWLVTIEIENRPGQWVQREQKGFESYIEALRFKNKNNAPDDSGNVLRANLVFQTPAL